MHTRASPLTDIECTLRYIECQQSAKPHLYRFQTGNVCPVSLQAIYLITTGARESSFRNIKTIAECLADEIINAARGSSNSYAIKKKDEIERVAKANR